MITEFLKIPKSELKRISVRVLLKQIGVALLIAPLFLSTLSAVEIPVIDLSRTAHTTTVPVNSYNNYSAQAYPSSASSLMADAPFQEPPTPVYREQASLQQIASQQAVAGFQNESYQPEQSTQPTHESNQAPQQGRTLRLYFRELSILRQAALAAGGDIKVSIAPVGITAEDMIVPLSQTGWFELKADGNVIVVQSRTDDPYLAKVRTEIGKLERRRSYLLHDLKLLEKMAQSDNQNQKLPAVPQLVIPQNQNANPTRSEPGSVSSTSERVIYSSSDSGFSASSASFNSNLNATYVPVSARQGQSTHWVEGTSSVLTQAPHSQQSQASAYRLASSIYSNPQNQAVTSQYSAPNASISPNSTQAAQMNSAVYSAAVQTSSTHPASSAMMYPSQVGQSSSYQPQSQLVYQPQAVQRGQGPFIETSPRLDPAIAGRMLQESINPPGSLPTNAMEPRDVPSTPATFTPPLTSSLQSPQAYPQ